MSGILAGKLLTVIYVARPVPGAAPVDNVAAPRSAVNGAKSTASNKLNTD